MLLDVGLLIKGIILKMLGEVGLGLRSITILIWRLVFLSFLPKASSLRIVLLTWIRLLRYS